MILMWIHMYKYGTHVDISVHLHDHLKQLETKTMR